MPSFSASDSRMRSYSIGCIAANSAIFCRLELAKSDIVYPAIFSGGHQLQDQRAKLGPRLSSKDRSVHGLDFVFGIAARVGVGPKRKRRHEESLSDINIVLGFALASALKDCRKPQKFDRVHFRTVATKCCRFWRMLRPCSSTV